jgi:hypothetical protein
VYEELSTLEWALSYRRKICLFEDRAVVSSLLRCRMTFSTFRGYGYEDPYIKDGMRENDSTSTRTSIPTSRMKTGPATTTCVNNSYKKCNRRLLTTGHKEQVLKVQSLHISDRPRIPTFRPEGYFGPT